MDITTLTQVVKEILKNVPYKPFFCLPLSAILYADLNDNYKIPARLVTGDLHFKDQIIFKQDFSIKTVKHEQFQSWSGHAWVEIDNLICDLSIFRTLYSPGFTIPCKKEMIALFGEGKGCLIATRDQLKINGLKYKISEELSDQMATGIIKGFDTLLRSF